MSQHTDWQDLEATVNFPGGSDTIHASIHPGGDSVTVNYRGGEPFVIETAHLGDFIALLQRVQDSL